MSSHQLTVCESSSDKPTLGIIFADGDDAKQLQEPVIGFDLYEGINALVQVSGIGMLNAAMTAIDLCQHRVDAIVNIGTCGSNSLKRGTVFTPECFLMSDMLVNGRLILDPNHLHTNSFDLTKIPVESLCFSSNSFVTKDSEIIKQKIKGNFEMEAYGIATVCKCTCMPFYAIKAVSDHLDYADYHVSDVLSINSRKIQNILKDIYNQII